MSRLLSTRTGTIISRNNNHNKTASAAASLFVQQQQMRSMSSVCFRMGNNRNSGAVTKMTTNLQPFTAISVSSSFQQPHVRYLSSVIYQPSPPAEITQEMAVGILETTQFFIRHGISHQRLKKIAATPTAPESSSSSLTNTDSGGAKTILQKWQEMMEIFLTTQVHVISGLGYPSNEQGLTQYAKDLLKCIESLHGDETMQQLLQEIRRDTWREIVSLAFDLNPDHIPTLSLVDARNLMHKVASRMIEPDVLLEIQQRVSILSDPDAEMEIAKRHAVLQDIIVNRVYLGGKPHSIVDDFNQLFDTNNRSPSPDKGYATMQCSMSDFEGDPLIAQYANSAMMKIWAAAGLDLDAITNQNNN